MLTLRDARGITFLTNEYDANGRVSRQTQADAKQSPQCSSKLLSFAPNDVILGRILVCGGW